ncbi:MAG: Fe-S cluster assembly sulfur transfer protein SufU [Gemmatimonadales bacterium]
MDVRELYQQVILDHNRSPRNFKVIDNANREASGDNPLCGDRITVYVRVNDGVIADVGFQGSGCAISQASASLMTTSVRGKSVAEARKLFGQFHSMVMGEHDSTSAVKSLGKLAALGGVREFPARVKCANLSWHTLKAALDGEPQPITTE